MAIPCSSSVVDCSGHYGGDSDYLPV